MKWLIICLYFACAASASLAQHKNPFSKERLSRIDNVLQGLVHDNKLAGGVVLVLHGGRTAYEKTFGWRDKEAKQKMKRDDIFRIASQTKAITSVATLILLEEGKLKLNDSASKFIPSFTKMKVRDEKGNDIPLSRPITIRDLLSHTSGISYGVEPQIAKQYSDNGLASMKEGRFALPLVSNNETICEAMDRLGALPIISQPGEAFVYGYNTDVLACIVERVSGLAFDKFVESRITKPLNMKDTQFFLDSDKIVRLVTVYEYDKDETIIRAPNGELGQGAFVEGPRKCFSGGGGLLSTAQDYARFLEMIRQGGELDGIRILSPRSVKLMTTNQVGSKYFNPGMGFGLGFSVVEDYGASSMKSPGTFGWAGAFGTVYDVDPQEKLTIVVMVQLIPWDKASKLHELYQNMIYQALH